MTIFRNWLWPFRPAPTADEIRRELQTRRQEHAVTIQQRDLIAFDAVRDEASAMRWQHLDDTTAALEQRMTVLSAALPKAEARERKAAEQAEAARRDRALVAFEQDTEEAERLVATVCGRLPDGETLTKLRDSRDHLAAQARELRPWSNDHRIRRPCDPLSEVVGAMTSRIARVERARHAPDSPITLEGGATAETLAAAAARIKTKGVNE